MLDLNDYLKDMAKRLRSVMGKDVEVVIASKSEHALVKADAQHINQMVMALSSNARDAMPRGGTFTLETNVVELEKKSPLLRPSMNAGEYIVLSIRDNGTGMDFSPKWRCFDPYFTTKEGHEGLGLTFVFAIVRSNGGDLSVRSDPGRGTTFTIYLPSAEQQSPLA